MQLGNIIGHHYYANIFASSHKDMTICMFASFATYHIAGKFDRDFNLRVWQSPG